jgi:hypothetical protein
VKLGDLTSSEVEATKWSLQELDDLIEILEKESFPYLIYKGFLTTVNSLQIANAAPFLSKIYLSDPWLHQETNQGGVFDEFKLQEPSLLREKDKITLISEYQFRRFINYNPFVLCAAPLFLDLSYYRSSLLNDFFTLHDFHHFRHSHSLKNDLDDLYQQMMPGALLIGNGINHSYVCEVLDQLAEQHQVDIQRKGSFWFLYRR